MDIKSYSDTNFDNSIFGDSNFGSSIKGQDYGHIVFELNANDNNDSFNFITKNYFQNTSPNYNNLLTIKADGKVGINTNNPSKQLEINGDLRISNDTPSNTTIKFIDSNNFVQNQLILQNNYLSFQNSNNIDLITLSNTSNNIGINNNNPTCCLDINDNKIRVRQSTETPTINTPGEEGEIRWNNNAIYICTGYRSTDSTYIWKKADLHSI